MIVSMRDRLFSMDVLAENGVPFRVLYGPGKVNRDGSSGVVEFYDRSRVFEPEKNGEFTGGRYMVADLLGEPGAPGAPVAWGTELPLNGSDAVWRVDGRAMLLVRQWLDTVRRRFEGDQG